MSPPRTARLKHPAARRTGAGRAVREGELLPRQPVSGMIGAMENGNAHLPTTEAAVAAIRNIAEEYALRMSVTDDIGADQTSRRTSAGIFTVLDPDGSLPHEAFVELEGSPSVSVRIFSEGDAKITVDGVEFHDVPRDRVPAFLKSVYGGLAYTKGRLFPPGQWLVVPLPGDETYKELIVGAGLAPWPARRIRPPGDGPRDTRSP